jgi:cation:H+ antiporter
MVELLQFAFGLGALVLGADVLVRGAARLALGWGLSPLVIGLTVVAFGTSAPELAVSVGAALDGRTDIALGNVVGSNIFNILGILGLSALILPLAVNLQIIRQEVPVMIGSALLLALLALDGEIGVLDGAMLFGLLLVYTGFLVHQSRRLGADAGESEFAADIGQATATRPLLSAAMVAGGLLLLVAGAQALVAAATGFARDLGLSELVIGLTIVAVGTSLPELATSIMAALRGQRDIAVGNVIGSCVFNILGCLGLTALVAGGGVPVAPSVLRFDLWVMIAASLACLPIFVTGRSIARWEGAVLLSYYAAYTVYLLLAAQSHASIDVFSDVLIGFVAPLTTVALVASLMRSPRR